MIKGNCDPLYLVSQMSDDEAEALKSHFEEEGLPHNNESVRDYVLKGICKVSVEAWYTGMNNPGNSTYNTLVPVVRGEDVALEVLEGIVHGGYIDPEDAGLHLILKTQADELVDLHLAVVASDPGASGSDSLKITVPQASGGEGDGSEENPFILNVPSNSSKD